MTTRVSQEARNKTANYNIKMFILNMCKNCQAMSLYIFLLLFFNHSLNT